MKKLICLVILIIIGICADTPILIAVGFFWGLFLFFRFAINHIGEDTKVDDDDTWTGQASYGVWNKFPDDRISLNKEYKNNVVYKGVSESKPKIVQNLSTKNSLITYGERQIHFEKAEILDLSGYAVALSTAKPKGDFKVRDNFMSLKVMDLDSGLYSFLTVQYKEAELIKTDKSDCSLSLDGTVEAGDGVYCILLTGKHTSGREIRQVIFTKSLLKDLVK